MDHPRNYEHAENPDLSPQEVKEKALGEFQTKFDHMAAQVIRGEVQGSATGEAARLIGLYADDAADQADAAEVRRCVELIRHLPREDHTEADRVAINFAGVRVGDHTAEAELATLLEDDKLKQEMEVLTTEAKRGFQAPDLTRSRLQQVVYKSVEHGIDPGGWVNDFAANEEHRIAWTIKYTKDMLKQPDLPESERQMYEVRLQATAIGLFESGIRQEFVGAILPDALRSIETAEVRRDLLDRQYDRLSRAESTSWGEFKDYVKLGAYVVNDPELRRPEEIAEFERSIEGIGQVFMERTGRSAYEVGEVTLDWKLALQHYRDPSAEHFVAELDSQIGQLLNDFQARFSRMPASEMVTQQGSITDKREELLNRYALHKGKNGDFAGARQLMAAMTSEPQRAITLAALLGETRSVEEVASLTPDELTLQRHPELQYQFDAARLRVEGNYQAQYDFAREVIADPEALLDKVTFLNRMYEDLGNDKHFAAYVLSAAREADEDSDAGEVAYWFSNIMLEAGDAREPQREYEDILRRADDRFPFDYMSQLWDLARKIPGTN